MKVIFLFDRTWATEKFLHVFYKLFNECKTDLGLTGEPSESKYGLDLMFNVPKEEFIQLLQDWAFNKYKMTIRFIKTAQSSNAYGMIVVGWEGLNKEDCESVLLNMYPEIEQ